MTGVKHQILSVTLTGVKHQIIYQSLCRFNCALKTKLSICLSFWLGIKNHIIYLSVALTGVKSQMIDLSWPLSSCSGLAGSLHPAMAESCAPVAPKCRARHQVSHRWWRVWDGDRGLARTQGKGDGQTKWCGVTVLVMTPPPSMCVREREDYVCRHWHFLCQCFGPSCSSTNLISFLTCVKSHAICLKKDLMLRVFSTDVRLGMSVMLLRRWDHMYEHYYKITCMSVTM